MTFDFLVNSKKIYVNNLSWTFAAKANVRTAWQIVLLETLTRSFLHRVIYAVIFKYLVFVFKTA